VLTEGGLPRIDVSKHTSARELAILPQGDAHRSAGLVAQAGEPRVVARTLARERRAG